MSKQSEAKQGQGYNPRPILPICKNCKFYTSKVTNVYDIWNIEYPIETQIRCDIGGFAIKKMGACKLYEEKDKS